MKFEPINEQMSHKFLCQMCFQCMILMREAYKLQKNKSFMISITKSEMLSL
jgi:hypothetical protein